MVRNFVSKALCKSLLEGWSADFQNKKTIGNKTEEHTWPICPISDWSSGLADPCEISDGESENENAEESSLFVEVLQPKSLSSCADDLLDLRGDALWTEKIGALWHNPTY